MSLGPPIGSSFWEGFDEGERMYILNNWDDILFSLLQYETGRVVKSSLLDNIPGLRSHLATLLARWKVYTENGPVFDFPVDTRHARGDRWIGDIGRGSGNERKKDKQKRDINTETKTMKST